MGVNRETCDNPDDADERCFALFFSSSSELEVKRLSCALTARLQGGAAVVYIYMVPEFGPILVMASNSFIFVRFTVEEDKRRLRDIPPGVSRSQHNGSLKQKLRQSATVPYFMQAKIRRGGRDEGTDGYWLRGRLVGGRYTMRLLCTATKTTTTITITTRDCRSQGPAPCGLETRLE